MSGNRATLSHMTTTPTRLYASEKTLIGPDEVTRIRHLIGVALPVIEADIVTFRDRQAQANAEGDAGGERVMRGLAEEFTRYRDEGETILRKIDAVSYGPGEMLAFAAFDLHDLDDIIDALDDAEAEVDG